MSESPGTVSKILWHFTGGPSWDNDRHCQTEHLKPLSSAFEALCGVLSERTLRVGTYREAVSVCVPGVESLDEDTRQPIVRPGATYHVESSPVCCLADIPFPHLGYHARRYGNMAIGFHRPSAISHGFNPVFYTPNESAVIRTIYGGLNKMRLFDTTELYELLDTLQGQLDAVFAPEHPSATQLATIVRNICLEVASLQKAADVTLESFQHFLGFSKTFRDDQFGTIYCEREWRSIRPYQFTLDDVAMIVLPRHADGV